MVNVGVFGDLVLAASGLLVVCAVYLGLVVGIGGCCTSLRCVRCVCWWISFA